MSLATVFIQQRLELISKMRKQPLSLDIIDKRDANGQSLGTTVKITIPILS